MPRRYMVGTPDDWPLLIVEHNAITYSVHMQDKEVFLDVPGLPKLTDEKLVKTVLEKAATL